jgi:hypothetical protein
MFSYKCFVCIQFLKYPGSLTDLVHKPCTYSWQICTKYFFCIYVHTLRSDQPIVENPEQIVEVGGKTVYVVFKYLSRSQLWKGVGAGIRVMN